MQTYEKKLCSTKGHCLQAFLQKAPTRFPFENFRRPVKTHACQQETLLRYALKNNRKRLKTIKTKSEGAPVRFGFENIRKPVKHKCGSTKSAHQIAILKFSQGPREP